jgi:hypothetical protein
MKKTFLISLLAAVVFALPGCNGTESPSDPYLFKYTMKNDTDREIVVSYDDYYYGGFGYGTDLRTITVAPGKSEVVIGYIIYGDYTKPMPVSDIFADDDVIPFGGIKLDDINDETWEEMATKVMVGDREAPHSIWLRKHWSFEEKNYEYNYTLTVTDDLLEALGMEFAQEEQEPVAE